MMLDGGDCGFARLSWPVVTVGLQWFVFVCDLVVRGWVVVVVVVMAVVVGGGGCGFVGSGRDKTLRRFSKGFIERERVCVCVCGRQAKKEKALK